MTKEERDNITAQIARQSVELTTLRRAINLKAPEVSRALTALNAVRYAEDAVTLDGAYKPEAQAQLDVLMPAWSGPKADLDDMQEHAAAIEAAIASCNAALDDD